MQYTCGVCSVQCSMWLMKCTGSVFQVFFLDFKCVQQCCMDSMFSTLISPNKKLIFTWCFYKNLKSGMIFKWIIHPNTKYTSFFPIKIWFRTIDALSSSLHRHGQQETSQTLKPWSNWKTKNTIYIFLLISKLFCCCYLMF